MAYDDYLADRIRRQLKDKHIAFDELKMMGGLCFKVDNKMLCGIHIDKKPARAAGGYGDSLLMARVGEAVYLNELEKTRMFTHGFYRVPHEGLYLRNFCWF
tara:strand:- start:7040 stop:7342 length:303 start_codon:yes stop_codon:yes gene_type:complete